MVYGARLESGFTRKGIEGSNPSTSAKKEQPRHKTRLFFLFEAFENPSQPMKDGVWSAIPSPQSSITLSKS